MYKLSPSDFAYLYEECKYCYYLKVHYGITRPSMPMPGVFGAINSRLQGALIGHDLKELSPNLPEGVVESQERLVESKPVPYTSVYIKGKYDLLVRRPDGTHMIVDLKITKPDDEKGTRYQTQLLAYKYAFEHPAKNELKKITKMGLVMLYPDTVEMVDGNAKLSFPPKWLEVAGSDDSFLAFMISINDLLKGKTPPKIQSVNGVNIVIWVSNWPIHKLTIYLYK